MGAQQVSFGRLVNRAAVMRSLISNIHVQTEVDLASGVGERIQARAWLAPPVDGWSSVFDETAETLGADANTELAQHLSQQLGAAVLGFTVYDDDSFIYTLHEQGVLVEKREVTSRDGAPSGRPVEILRYCRAGTAAEALMHVLEGPADEGMGTASSSSSEQVRLMLNAGSDLFRSLPAEVVDQLMARVEKETGVDPDHPMLQAFRANRQALLDTMAERSDSLRAQTDQLAHRPQTSMEPAMRLLGSATTIPSRLDALATLLGLSERIPLTFSLVDSPEDEDWRLVVRRARGLSES